MVRRLTVPLPIARETPAKPSLVFEKFELFARQNRPPKTRILIDFLLVFHTLLPKPTLVLLRVELYAVDTPAHAGHSDASISLVQTNFEIVNPHN